VAQSRHASLLTRIATCGEPSGGWLTRSADRSRVVDRPAPLEATLELAQTRLLAQIADETSLDGRTVGILAFLGALLAVDVAAKDILGTWWWTPLVGVGLATLPCLRSILSKDTDLGPLSVTFYATYGGHPSTAAREQLLADLADAFENNAARMKTKRSSLRWALAIIAPRVSSGHPS
jgi:hypothetical protein